MHTLKLFMVQMLLLISMGFHWEINYDWKYFGWHFICSKCAAYLYHRNRNRKLGELKALEWKKKLFACTGLLFKFVIALILFALAHSILNSPGHETVAMEKISEHPSGKFGEWKTGSFGRNDTTFMC